MTEAEILNRLKKIATYKNYRISAADRDAVSKALKLLKTIREKDGKLDWEIEPPAKPRRRIIIAHPLIPSTKDITLKESFLDSEKRISNHGSSMA